LSKAYKEGIEFSQHIINSYY